MMTPRLALVGNIIIDDVYGVRGWPVEGTSNEMLWHRRSIGGLGNIAGILPGLRVSVSAVVGEDAGADEVSAWLDEMGIDASLSHRGRTSRALIVSSAGTCERTSFVDWGCGREAFSAEPDAEWAHVSYLDVTGAVIRRRRGQVISADLCLSNPSRRDRMLLAHRLVGVDFLFVSAAEATGYFPRAEPMMPLSPVHGARALQALGAKTVVLHERDGTTLVTKKEIVKVGNPAPILDGVDVLGAGDFYCGSFIEYMLTKEASPEGAAVWAHERTSEILKRRREREEIQHPGPPGG